MTVVKVIDAHAHVLPAELMKLTAKRQWHGFTVKQGASGEMLLERGQRCASLHPHYFLLPEERINLMDSLGIDVQLLSPWSQLYSYHLPAPVAVATAHACNDHIAGMVRTWPLRFAGLGTLPMQDVSAAIDELERGVTQLGLKGAVINDHVNGRTYDLPEFIPFWQAAEQLGALIMFHHAQDDTVTDVRCKRFGVGDSVGGMADRAIVFAALAFGGVLDRHPQLKLCLCHAGGYTCFGAGRMDRGWQVRPEARIHLDKPPSRYLRRFYYDSASHGEPSLRFVLDTVGADRVVLGGSWPYDAKRESPVRRIRNMGNLGAAEKEAILSGNLRSLLGLQAIGP